MSRLSFPNIECGQHPENPKKGEVAFLTDRQKAIMWDGDAWRDLPTDQELQYLRNEVCDLKGLIHDMQKQMDGIKEIVS